MRENLKKLNVCKMNKKILLTGSTGHIGRILSDHFINNGFYVRGFDKRKSHHVSLDDFVQGDLEDLDLLRNSMQEMDCTIHLAAFSDDGDFINDLLKPNIIGVYNLFEAARLENIQQVIMASSVQNADIESLSGKIGTEDRFPSNHYAALKVWSEDVGRMYSRLHGISVLSFRIGWVLKDRHEVAAITKNRKFRSLYLSHNDLRRFFLKCISSSLPNYATIYALSRQENKEQYDMDPSWDIIGFAPDDVFPEGLDFPVNTEIEQCG